MSERDAITAERLERRLHTIAWWREALRVHPGGLVPVNTAARILGVERARVYQLVADGRLPVLDMPGGARHDRFVPLDALLMAPSPRDAGRPLRYSAAKGYRIRQGKAPNIYGSMGSSDTTATNSGKIPQSDAG